jgi:hypothetical protein
MVEATGLKMMVSRHDHPTEFKKLPTGSRDYRGGVRHTQRER